MNSADSLVLDEFHEEIAMKMNKMCKSAAVAVACVLLTSCGGGSPGTNTPAALIVGDVRFADPDVTIGAGARAAANRPRFGSVTQSSNAGSAAGVTGDVASVSFDGRNVRVTVRRTDGSSVALNSASHGVFTKSLDPILSGYSFRADGMRTYTDTSATLAMVLTNWNSADPNDYLAGGYWMRAVGRVNPLAITRVEIGAFADGPEISGDPALPVSGSASYTGTAGGLYGYKSGSTGATQIGEFNGVASLTADFSGSPTISGCIGCNGVVSFIGIAASGSGQTATSSGSIPVRMRMQAAPVTEGAFTGNVRMERGDKSVTSSSGSWGGRFSTKTQAGDPRLVAGTIGSEWTEVDGSQGTAVGAWLGIRN